MIYDLPKWWALLTYCGLKYHVNFTEVLGFFSEERIKVDKEEACTSAFNKSYDELQTKKYKSQTRQILYMVRRKVHVQINQWQIIMIIYTDIHNIYSKVWTYSFVAVNLHLHHCLYFSDWIKKISPSVNTVETV